MQPVWTFAIYFPQRNDTELIGNQQNKVCCSLGIRWLLGPRWRCESGPQPVAQYRPWAHVRDVIRASGLTCMNPAQCSSHIGGGECEVIIRAGGVAWLGVALFAATSHRSDIHTFGHKKGIGLRLWGVESMEMYSTAGANTCSEFLSKSFVTSFQKNLDIYNLFETFPGFSFSNQSAGEKQASRLRLCSCHGVTDWCVFIIQHNYSDLLDTHAVPANCAHSEVHTRSRQQEWK